MLVQKRMEEQFIDAFTSEEDENVTVNIVDSNFVECYSLFGGAILQLEGYLNIDNCNFTSNEAFFDGGAIYTSWAYVNVTNSKFNNNSVVCEEERGSFGGAIFSDGSMLTLSNTELTDNSAFCGGAIYFYDGDYDIENNLFVNNTKLNGTYNDIYSDFDGPTHILLNNNFSSDDSVSVNNVIYASFSDVPGMEVHIINNSIDVTSIPSKFDLRDWGWVTPVGDQGQSGVCWAFSCSGPMEAAILRYLGVVMDVSENNIVDVSLKYSRYGVATSHEGGDFKMGAAYALSWLGLFSSDYDDYDEIGKISPLIAADNIHFQDMVIIPGIEDLSEMDIVKKALLKYGALSVSYYAAQIAPYYNEVTGAQYCNDETVTPDHGVTLIGWDDSYSKDNFIITPPGDGAWIFKNSWGESVGNDGYFYISYYDSTFLKFNSYTMIFDNDVMYTKNYQYDIQGKYFYLDSSNEYRNNFEAMEDDLIAAVGTYFNDVGVEYTAEIYVNGELKHVQKGLSPFAGYHTIKLDSYVPIKKGDNFTVKFKSAGLPVLGYSRLHILPGSSEFLDNNGTWVDAVSQGVICCIKAYTLADDTKIINIKNISVDYAGGSYFSVKVVTADGHAVGAGEKVKFTINGKTSTVQTDKNGIAKIKITQLPKKYAITTTYNGKSYKNTVTVKQVLKTTKFSVKNTDKKLILKATLKINGKAVKGKVIKFTFRGKTYNAKTNANGIAAVTIKENLIKKLTGKSYAVKMTYLKDSIKTTVTVKQVLKASKATVKKTAKSFRLKASLKINGKVAKAKVIKFTLLGKTYNAKTNAKGIATLTVKKAVINKLKKGKTYSVKVAYGKDSVKTTVRVR